MISSPVGFRPPSPSLPARHIKDINSHAQTNKFMWPPLQSNWRNWNWININSDAQTNKFFWPYPKSNWRYCTKVNWLWRISEPNNGAGKWLYRFAWLRWDKYTFKNPWLSHLVCSVGMLLVIWRPMADMLDMRRELYGELIGMPATPPRAIVPKYVGTTITDCQRYCPWFKIYYDWFCGSERSDDYNWNSGTLLYLANIIAVIDISFAVKCSRSHSIGHCCRSCSCSCWSFCYYCYCCHPAWPYCNVSSGETRECFAQLLALANVGWVGLGGSQALSLHLLSTSFLPSHNTIFNHLILIFLIFYFGGFFLYSKYSETCSKGAGCPLSNFFSPLFCHLTTSSIIDFPSIFLAFPCICI